MKRPSSTRSRRKQAGRWLQELRRKARLTQLGLAAELGVKHCGFISQVENGFSRVPQDKFAAWAHAVGVQPSYFARYLLSFYEPELSLLLYGDDSRMRNASVVAADESLAENKRGTRIVRKKRGVQPAR